MGRPRTPTKILELRGSFKRNPQRRRSNEPTPIGGVGEPPEHLAPAVRGLWDEIVAIIAPGVLAVSDRLTLELTATLMEEFRRKPQDFPASKYARLQALLAVLGLNPSDRSRLGFSRTEAAEASPWDELGSIQQ